MNLGYLAEVTRGNFVESRHLGRAIIVDRYGKVVWAVGDGDSLIFPRSTIKPFLVLEFVKSGAVDRLNFSDDMIALACASHGGEAAHVALVAEMLKRVGLDGKSLECGAHWSSYAPAAYQWSAQGHQCPSELHNSCSGKHAALICLSCDQGVNPQDYTDPAHIMQRRVTEMLEHVTTAPHLEENLGIDGCSFPTYAIEIQKLAYGFARFATGEGLEALTAKAAERVRSAVAAHPFMIAGTNRFETILMEHFRERLFLKMGAEGIMVAALPYEGLGIVVKAEDGAARAAEAAMAGLLLRFGEKSLLRTQEDTLCLEQWAQQPLVNWNGHQVGMLQAAF